jgi:cation-transporting ATPase E
MRESTKPYTETIKALPGIFSRHAFLFVNGIIFSVSILLYVFGSKDSAIFIGIITVINMTLGIVQDTRSKYSLEKLQLITALTFVKLNEDKSEEQVYIEELNKGDRVKIKLGDQIPIDGVIEDSSNLEMSSALITGESDSLSKKVGDKVLAGEIVTAGFGVVLLESTYTESRISQMTNTIKEYTATQSPIQNSVSKIINISSLVLTAIILFVATRGFIVGDSYITIVNNIGALASVVIPQGLVVITTLLFAFGAASYSDKHVLFQEINATEKLGRIKYLCMDKTGTLTNNQLTFEKMYIRDGYDKDIANELTMMYILGSGDSSKTVEAIKKNISNQNFSQKVLKSFPFSSWRGYGGVYFEEEGKNSTIFLGPPEVFLRRVSDASEAKWLKEITDAHTKAGNRVLCFAQSIESDYIEDINNAKLTVVAVYAFSSGLREGIGDSINFFQDRGVVIRIITGDNPETAVSVACSAGVSNCEKVITGFDMKDWTDDDYKNKIKNYFIFARIIPEQKVKIIDTLKKEGFTAMVGDGANDALAIKKADLGIAMFDGVPATRKLAGVILMNNSFTALPGAVALADSFILNIQILASLFLYQALIGTFFFVFISLFGYSYPILPLNITVTNYFTIGIPGMLIAYWALRPDGVIKAASTESFIKKVLPFPLISSILGSILMMVVFLLMPHSVRVMDTNIITLISLILCGFVFFVCTPKVYQGIFSKTKKIHFLILLIAECVLFFVLTKIPFVVKFFSLKEVSISMNTYEVMGLVVVLYVALQYGVTRYFAKKK